MARIKPNPYIIADRAQCEGALAEIAALDRKLSTIENDMQEAVDAAKSKASQLAGLPGLHEDRPAARCDG